MQSSRASESEHREQAGSDVTEQAAGEQNEVPEGERNLETELAAMEDRYKRAVADLDNYRKRSLRELEGRIAEATDAQLLEWLQAVDSVDRALAMQFEHPEFDGLIAVLDQMEAILARQGVQRIGARGEPFDPERHQAIGMRPDDGVPDGTVAEVVRSGYVRGGRVLRPAEVIVARAQRDGA